MHVQEISCLWLSTMDQMLPRTLVLMRWSSKYLF